MCWFLTLGIIASGAADVEALGRQRAGLGVRPSKNPYLAAIFPKDDLRFELTHAGCSCALAPEAPERTPAHSETLRHRYERQGWSAAKIARALQAAEAAQSKRRQRREEAAAKRLFREAIVEQARRSGSVRVFLHFYRGSQDAEEVVCSGRRRVGAGEFGQGDLPEDVLVEVIA
jgi:hypothetical protein